MITNSTSAPPPQLRIVHIDAVLPHETSDLQRSGPLIERLRTAQFFTNPPVVGAAGDGKYVLMDGANRYHSLKHLGFAHILVQVADYQTAFVELGVWQHIAADWNSVDFIRQLRQLEAIDIRAGSDSDAVAQIRLREGQTYSIHAAVEGIARRNAALRRIVAAYHGQTTLYRTPLTDPAQIWPLYPTAIALIMFLRYAPQDIIEAALKRAYLPPGVSRHIIHGRALKLNYPMSRLRGDLPLEEKNRQLQQWTQQKLAERSVRYYAEATWQFDE